MSSDFSLLADESTDEAGRSQLAIFVRFIDPTTNLPTEQFSVRKLGPSKTSEAIMMELEEMFEEKHINHFSFFWFGWHELYEWHAKWSSTTNPTLFPLCILHKL